MPQITKTKIECYKLRDLRNGNWADITIDADGERGRLQIASSYGDYQHYWNACGAGFKRFLTGLNLDYLADKLNADLYYDIPETVRLYREVVIDRRKSDGVKKETARKVWDEIKQLEDCSQRNFKTTLENQSNLLSFFDWMPEISRTITPQFKRFWAECWLVLMEEFKRELNKESELMRIDQAA